MSDHAQVHAQLQHYTHAGNCVYHDGITVAYCTNAYWAWLFADRLNAFEANLQDRNQFQQMYLRAVAEMGNEE